MAKDISQVELEKQANTPRTVYNPMGVDFTHTWDKVSYIIPAGKSMIFPGYLAVHMAKHLAEFIMIHGYGRLNDTVLPDGKIKPNSMSRGELQEFMEKELLDKGDVESYSVLSENGMNTEDLDTEKVLGSLGKDKKTPKVVKAPKVSKKKVETTEDAGEEGEPEPSEKVEDGESETDPVV